MSKKSAKKLSDESPFLTVAVWLDAQQTDYFQNKLRGFAQSLALPLIHDPQQAKLLLGCDAVGLYVFDSLSDKTRLQLDFDQFDLKLNVRDPLVKAIGHCQDKPVLQVLDLTAGWGEDAIHLTHAGFNVIALERNALVYAMLDEAWLRAENQKVRQSLEFIHTDAVHYLQALEQPVDTIYYDPMFPEKKRKSAGVRKQMSFMQTLVGEVGKRHETQQETQQEKQLEAQILSLARSKANRRVVVKRPLKADSLPGSKPSGSVKGKLVRFDIYPPTGNNH